MSSTMIPKRTALITGATGVIGSAIAERFAKSGYRLVLSGRSPTGLSRLQKRLLRHGGAVDVFAADVSKERDMKRLMRRAARKFKSLDVLVAAAGVYGEIGPLQKSETARWRDAIETNLFGTALAVKYALPLLKKSRPRKSRDDGTRGTRGNPRKTAKPPRGKIICFAGGGDGPLPNFTSYAASKGAVVRLVESLSQEFLEYGIDINAISPGLVKSGFTRALIKVGPKRAGKESYEAARQELFGKKETVSPEKAAELALFLASAPSDGITGKNISAVWDNWHAFPKHVKTLGMSDIYNWRRVKPKDRGYDW